jgi:gliding motility-associated protein GldM
MAGGGKQSPRQRMINMMYLVLTALLALQVSSSIIDKFIFLNASLEHSLEASRNASESALAALKKQVEKEGNTAEGRERIKRAEELKKKTAILIGDIDKLKNKIIKEAGEGIDEKTGAVKNPKEETKVEVMMLGPEGRKNGLGYDLEKKLNKFTEDLIKDYSDVGVDKALIVPLAEGNAKNPIYKYDRVQRDKDFAQANFGQTPVVAALAVLTQKQTEIIRYEQEVLKKLGAGEFGKEIKFDKIIANASADANIVAQGSEYTAELFLSATSSKAGARMVANGAPITPNADGVGKVKFNASGIGEQVWKGTITINNRGKDTTFVIEKKYTVVQAVLLVKAASNFPLYRNCANPLETAVPALGAAYRPSFSVDNGTAIPGGRVGDVTIFPGAGPACKLTVSSGGRVVGVADFRVNPVPPPKIFLCNRSGGAINLKDPIPLPPTLTVCAEADETFRNTLPKEANYRVVSVEAYLFRGGRSIGQTRGAGGTINASALGAARPGDGVQIIVNGVQRVNSRGEIETAPINTPYIGFFTR